MKIKSGAAGTLALALSFGLASAQAEVSQGALMASNCFSCHGTDGRAIAGMPSIYGIPSEILVTNMKAFRDGTRPSTVMGRHARGYTDEEIQLIADYLSTLR